MKTLVDEHASERRASILIFATTYVASPHRARLLDQWLTLTRRLNPDCDILIVDSCSPWPRLIDKRHGEFVQYNPGMQAPRMIHSFPDNIGHLFKNGKNGWGRAFCFGLEAAISSGYDYVVHIEGDSLFRLPVTPIVQQMQSERVNSVSTAIGNTLRRVETGLMFFRTRYLAESKFVDRYDWPNRTNTPDPEVVVASMLKGQWKVMPWRALRGDTNQITVDNAGELDWITHCDSGLYDRFFDLVCGRVKETPEMVKLNFGCRANKIVGWQNFDNELDISKRLPFADRSADFIFCEHCVERVDYYAAIEFFKECRRVLKPAGVIRISVPSVEMIWKCGDAEYYKFTTKWQKIGATARGAMHSIMYAHGHKMVWTASLMEASLYYAGFDKIVRSEPHVSAHADLIGVEGHHRVIGERFNAIESLVYEGSG